MTKCVEEVIFPQNFKENEIEFFKHQIRELLVKLKENINRLDGILVTESKHLILLTEFEIIEFEVEHYKFQLIQKILLLEIDYITLTRNGKKLIFHLVENKTFDINHEKLEKVAACICSSFFYDKSNFTGKGNIGRQISVIIINEHFNIVPVLETTSNFYDYK